MSDPRYEKLQGMIEAGRANFDQTIKSIMEES